MQGVLFTKTFQCWLTKHNNHRPVNHQSLLSLALSQQVTQSLPSHIKTFVKCTIHYKKLLRVNKYTETYGNIKCITHTLRHNFRLRSSITFIQPELYTAEPALSFITAQD